MSKFSNTFSIKRDSREQNGLAQINMAPMIDFLVITIAYFLISASFCSVGLIDSTFQAGQNEAGNGAGGGSAVTKREIEITLKSNHSLSVKQTNEANATEMSREALLSLLQEASAQGNLEMVSLNAESGISFDEIIRVFNKIRQIAPSVSLNVDSI